MIRKFFILCILFITVRVFSQELNGIWLLNTWVPTGNLHTLQFSWGADALPITGEGIAIDYNENNPRIYITGLGDYPIKLLSEVSENCFKMVFYFLPGHFDVECLIHKISDTEIWIEAISKDTILFAGENFHYFRVSGPETVKKIQVPLFGKINSDNVEIKTAPNFNSKTLYELYKNTIVVLYRRSSDTSEIDGIKRSWYFIETEDNIKGWIYGAYIDFL